MEKWLVDTALKQAAKEAAKPFKRRQKKYDKELEEYHELQEEIYWSNDCVAWGDR